MISGWSRIFERRFLVLQKFSSELVEEYKKATTSFFQHFQHSKSNLPGSNTPNLTHYASITRKTSSLTMQKGRGTILPKCVLH